MFLVHEISGLDLYFANVAGAIDDDIPVYGLSGVADDESQLCTVEGIAARLARVIREFQPTGPYRIAGWSFGGVVAYEIAIQLIGQDQPVEFVGLLDAFHPALMRLANGAGSVTNSAQSGFLDQFSVALSARARGSDAFKAIEASSQSSEFSDLVQRCLEIGPLPVHLAGCSPSELKHLCARYASHRYAVDNYDPTPISVPVYLFAAQDMSALTEVLSRADAFRGWTTVLPEDQIHLVPVIGSHQTITSTHVDNLGKALTRSLNDAEISQTIRVTTSDSPHVLIQRGDENLVPVFCIAGAGDQVFQFLRLADALGSKYPVHGLQHRGVDLTCEPHSTVEAAAAQFLRAIEAVQPHGPIHLIGHSYGGWIAFEIALQMSLNGQAVASLTIIDSEAPEGTGVGREYTANEVLSEFSRVLELAAGEPLGIEVNAFASLDEMAKVRLIHGRMVAVGMLPARSQPEMLRGPIRTFAAALRTGYNPKVHFPGRVRLALARDAHPLEGILGRLQDNALEGWRRWAPDIVRWDAPGNHLTILKDPNVEFLAKWWQAAFEPDEIYGQ
ncbi:MAG: thioesterase domain-containing protein [Vulcanimicrobiaceae bacterium]